MPLSPKALETLREYWRWMKPKTYLFPGTVNGSRADKPITPKVLWEACREAAQRAGITKAVRPHLLQALCRVPDYAARIRTKWFEALEIKGCWRASHLTCGIVRRLGIRVV